MRLVRETSGDTTTVCTVERFGRYYVVVVFEVAGRAFIESCNSEEHAHMRHLWHVRNEGLDGDSPLLRRDLALGVRA